MNSNSPVYPVALRLSGKRVLVVGGGSVAQRRVPGLIAAGAEVVVVSPEVLPALEALSASAEITWHAREFDDNDLPGAWYVVAATDSAEVNQRVSRLSEEQRTFCVRADDASAATAWTPASGTHDGLTISVVGNRDPRRSAAVRDQLIEAVRSGTVVSPPNTRVAGVVLVGGGPGNPDLVTVAARRALSEADVVVADRLAPRELLGELSSDIEIIDVTKLPRGRHTTQEEINRVIVDRALAGKRVVRFKGGDSFVFGRGFEEVLACAEAGVPCTVIPGVTSAISVPALAGIPVTHRAVAHDFTVVSGHLAPGHPDSLVAWGAVASLTGTVVLLMAVHNLAAISDALTHAGRAADTPVAIICDGSMPTERVVYTTLADLAQAVEQHQVRPPAIVVIGDVVDVSRRGDSG